ncbi:MAG: HD domain-containing protein [Cyanobium sp.]
MPPEPSSPVHSPRYGEALSWAAALHRFQNRKGKSVPYVSHLIAVSALVWEDGGDEEQAIAALLHDAIEDAGVGQEQIAARFGQRVARIVLDCTDTDGPSTAGAGSEPWLLRKTRHLDHLQGAPLESLLVSAADKAHNARDLLLDSRTDPALWSRFNGGLEGSIWYLLRLHQTFSHRLPHSRSTLLLGEALQTILQGPSFRAVVPEGLAPAVWAAGYLQRQPSA